MELLILPEKRIGHVWNRNRAIPFPRLHRSPLGYPNSKFFGFQKLVSLKYDEETCHPVHPMDDAHDIVSLCKM